MFILTQKIKECKKKLIRWNRNGYINSGKRIKELKYQLKEAKKQDKDASIIDRRIIKNQLSRVYREEEMFWVQKVRNKWLKKGDKNTAFSMHQSNAEEGEIILLNFKTNMVVSADRRMRSQMK